MRIFAVMRKVVHTIGIMLMFRELNIISVVLPALIAARRVCAHGWRACVREPAAKRAKVQPHDFSHQGNNINLTRMIVCTL